MFSPDYATARRRFRDAAARLGWELEAYPIEESGPNGEPLAIDVALSPGSGANRALVVSSGVHGVEGFFGSAVQLALLDGWARQPCPPSTRVVLIHALNPYGFAWRRRVDAHNVDLNRNFLLDGQAFAGAPPGYARLDPFLNPARPPSALDVYTLRALLTVGRRGMPVLKEAVATGQYDFPRGLFFGGHGPSPAQGVLRDHLERWLHDGRDVTHVDLHTGLGPRAGCRLLLDYTPTDRQRQTLTRWVGPDSFETPDSVSVAYVARGSLGQWCVSRFPGRDYLYVFAEFGTYGPIRMLGGLRRENQAHHWAGPGAPSVAASKARLAELFCPADLAWRRQVIDRAVALIGGVTGNPC